MECLTWIISQDLLKYGFSAVLALLYSAVILFALWAKCISKFIGCPVQHKAPHCQQTLTYNDIVLSADFNFFPFVEPPVQRQTFEETRASPYAEPVVDVSPDIVVQQLPPRLLFHFWSGLITT